MNKEELKRKLEQIVEKNASIGVHCPRKTDLLSETDIYNKVIGNGIYAKGGERSYHGITSTFVMCGQNGLDFNFDTLYNWSYGNIEKKDNYQIIIAIPEVIKNSENHDFILGIWKHIENSYESEKESKKNPYNNIDIIPPEFIVGAIVWDDIKTENDVDVLWKKGNERLIINSKYIGLKSEEEKNKFYDEYIKNLLYKKKVIEVTEKNLEIIKRMKEKDYISDDLYQLFMKTYNNSIDNVKKQDSSSYKIISEEISNYLNSKDFFDNIKNLYEIVQLKNVHADLKKLVNMLTSEIIKYYLLFKEDKNITSVVEFTNNLTNMFIEQINTDKEFDFSSMYLKEVIEKIYSNELDSLGIYGKLDKHKYIIEKLNYIYKFHGFSSNNLESIKQNGLDPSKRELPTEEMNIIHDIFSKHNIKMIFGWYKINYKNNVFYSLTPNISYNYALASPEWFSQFVGDATIYGKEGNATLLNNDYEKAVSNLTNVMNNYHFTDAEKNIVFNFLNKYWKIYANNKPMLFIEKEETGYLKNEDILNDAIELDSIDFTLNSLCLEYGAVDCRSDKIISPENSEIIELTDYQKIYNYINNNDYNKDIEEYKDLDYIDFDFKSIYKYFENKDLTALVNSYIFYGGLQEKIALDIENTGKKYDKIKNIIKNSNFNSIKNLEKLKNELQAYQTNMDISLTKYNDLMSLKKHIIEIIKNGFDLMSDNEKEDFISYLETIRINNTNSLKQHTCKYLYFIFNTRYEKSKENKNKK